MIIFSGMKERMLETAFVLEKLGLNIYGECEDSAAKRENWTCFTCQQGIVVEVGGEWKSSCLFKNTASKRSM